MEEEISPAIVSGDVENIIIKLEPSEDFLNDEDASEFEGINSEINQGPEDSVFYGEFNSNDTSFPSSEENESNIIQTPFFLENYFSDNDSGNVNQLIEMSYLTCENCKIIFTNERLLQEHLITHIDIHRMGCSVCDKDLIMAEKFQLHVMAISRQSIYYCDLCKKSCAGVVRSKYQARPLGKTYACHDCEIQEREKPTVVKGSTLIMQNCCNIENCSLHSGSFTVLEMLQIHKEKHNELSCNICPVCPKIVTSNTVLQLKNVKNDCNNVAFNLNGSKFNLDKCFHKCSLCNAFFVESFTLQRHIRERHNLYQSNDNFQQNLQLKTKGETTTLTFKCTFCEAVFSEKWMYTKHLKEEHEPPDRKKKSVKSNVETKSSAENKFKCDDCNVSYSENFNLTKHLREKHKKHKPKLVCTLCLKEFTLQRCFNNHVNIHKITKNYVCFECNLTFLSKYELQQHVKIHNQEPKCKKCEKKTLTQVNQKRNSKRTPIKNSR